MILIKEYSFVKSIFLSSLPLPLIPDSLFLSLTHTTYIHLYRQIYCTHMCSGTIIFIADSKLASSHMIISLAVFVNNCLIYNCDMFVLVG